MKNKNSEVLFFLEKELIHLLNKKFIPIEF